MSRADVVRNVQLSREVLALQARVAELEAALEASRRDRDAVYAIYGEALDEAIAEQTGRHPADG